MKQWTDRIRQVKIWLVAAAVMIAGASLYVSHQLVNDLKQEERTKMDLWAKAMNFVQEADGETDCRWPSPSSRATPPFPSS